MEFLRNKNIEGSRHYFRGPNLFLRHPRPGDWREWSELRKISREFLVPWEPTWDQDALSRRRFRRRLNLELRGIEKTKIYPFFLFRNSDKQLLGGVTLGNIQLGSSMSGSLGYWIGKPYARNGYMFEALSCLVSYAFEVLALHRLEAFCLPNNIASQKLLEKIGFRKEGRVADLLRINSRWEDHFIYNLLERDWQKPEWIK